MMETNKNNGCNTASAFSVVTSSSLDTLQVTEVTQPLTDDEGNAVQYVTDDGQTIAQWFVVESPNRVVPASVAVNAVGDGMQCLVCRQRLTTGWSVQNCYTKHAKTAFMTLLLDILLPDGYIGSAGNADAVCDSCATLLNAVDELTQKLRDTRQLIRVKYKRALEQTVKEDKILTSGPMDEAVAGINGAGSQPVSVLQEDWVLTSDSAGVQTATETAQNHSSDLNRFESMEPEIKIADSESKAGDQPDSNGIRCSRCSQALQYESDLQHHCTAVESSSERVDLQHDGDDRVKELVSNGCAELKVVDALMCECGEAFPSRQELGRHRVLKHWDWTVMKCRDCGLQLHTPRAFIEHRRVQHNDSKPFYCDLCEKRFTLMSSLKMHRRTHTGFKPFHCELCDKSFTQSASLQSHKRMHAGHRPHVCDVCQRSFREAHALKKHKLIHSGEKPYKCELCEQRFRQKCVLDRHVRTHTGERPYQCDVCELGFIDSTALRLHKVQHTGLKPYYCEHCGKGFSDSYWFSQHKRYHSGERPYKCDQCPKAFTDARILRTHQKLHSGDKPHICFVCGARFSNSSHLTRHSHIHTGARPYRCASCPQTFRDSSTLKRHEQTHAQASRPRHSCPDCGARFSRKETLTQHVQYSCKARQEPAAVNTIVMSNIVISNIDEVMARGPAAEVAEQQVLHMTVTAAGTSPSTDMVEGIDKRKMQDERQSLPQHRIIEQLQ